jgi:hypothetical protein
MFDTSAIGGTQRSLDHLGDEIADLSAQINAAKRRRLLLIAELDRRRGYEQQPGSSMGRPQEPSRLRAGPQPQVQCLITTIR